MSGGTELIRLLMSDIPVNVTNGPGEKRCQVTNDRFVRLMTLRAVEVVHTS